MVSYQDNDPKGWCGDPKRGAALGRPTVKGSPDYDGKLNLNQVDINNGGYDRNGTYFGLGQPLFWYASEDATIDAVVRAANRQEAKELIRKEYPKARFYR